MLVFEKKMILFLKKKKDISLFYYWNILFKCLVRVIRYVCVVVSIQVHLTGASKWRVSASLELSVWSVYAVIEFTE